jgi:hypothetical protein
MYKVLYRPALQIVCTGVPLNVIVGLVYEAGQRGTRLLLVSQAQTAKCLQEDEERFGIAAQMLNNPASLTVQKENLRALAQLRLRPTEDILRVYVEGIIPSMNVSGEFGNPCKPTPELLK